MKSRFVLEHIKFIIKLLVLEEGKGNRLVNQLFLKIIRDIRTDTVNYLKADLIKLKLLLQNLLEWGCVF